MDSSLKINNKKLGFRTLWKEYSIGTAFFLPFFLFFFAFTILPIIVAFITSLTNYDLINFPPSFVGLNNFKLLFMYDDIFYISLKNTLYFAIVSAPIGYFMSFLMAWLINQVKFKSAFSLAFYAPSITSAVAMSVVWLYFFSPDRYGLINNFLYQLGIITKPVLWTLNPNTIIPVVIIVSIWMSMGTGFLVFLAGLQSIPPELYEAGMIDGISSKFQELFYITLPHMKPQLLFGSINSIAGAFCVFDIAVSIAGLPSPNYAGDTLVTHLYDYAFIRFEMGYASAIAVVLFIMTFSLGRIFIRIFKTN